MNYVEMKIGKKEYKLRLNTRACVSLEKALGKNPIDIFMSLDDGTFPKITDIVLILHASLQAMNHGISIDDTYSLFDEYLDNGGSIVDIIGVFVEVFQEAGLIPKEATEEGKDEKNA